LDLRVMNPTLLPAELPRQVSREVTASCRPGLPLQLSVQESTKYNIFQEKVPSLIPVFSHANG
ncbi:MAG: hypothetical protein WDZ29_06620, partial [Balneolaceae bacterium]